MEESIQPITMPGVHSRFLEYFKKQEKDPSKKVLDLGAGQGALSQRLHRMGYEVSACDLFPENFKYKGVNCDRVDVTEVFPYTHDIFDLVIAIEVTEHILDHENFFKEINRILKPGGKLYISTPNILSLKSRVRFLFRGFPYAFKPLVLENYDGLQHIASLSLDQYNYIAVKYNFYTAEFGVDRLQSTSRWLYIFLNPLLWLNRQIKGFDPMHNQKILLTGRLLFMSFRKK
jgi:SAM-dependent methyltransferase